MRAGASATGLIADAHPPMVSQNPHMPTVLSVAKVSFSTRVWRPCGVHAGHVGAPCPLGSPVFAKLAHAAPMASASASSAGVKAAKEGTL